MIGEDRIPDGLKSIRLHRSGGAEDWRVGWDFGDDIAMKWLAAINETQASGPITVASFRSNVSKISILKESSRWIVAWDERFFDYLIHQLLLLQSPSAEMIAPYLYTCLLRYIGEAYVLVDPYYAVTLFHEAIRRDPGPKEVPKNKHIDSMIRAHFRVMRAFILAHEIGHVILQQPEAQEMERRNLRAVIERLRSALNDPNFFGPHARFYSSGPLSPQEFTAKMVAAADGGEHATEILVDFFAVRSVIDEEVAAVRAEGGVHADSGIAFALMFMYQSIRLLYLLTATMTKAREFLSPKAIRHGLDLDQFKSIAALEVRNDMRGHLWRLYSEQIHPLDSDTRRRVGAETNVVCLRYLSSQLPAFSNFINTFIDRQRLLSRADDLRNVQRRAGELYGYGSGKKS